MAVPQDRVITSCSFCLKPDGEVARLVAGPGVYICNECVDLCSQIIASPPSLPPGLTRGKRTLTCPVCSPASLGWRPQVRKSKTTFLASYSGRERLALRGRRSGRRRE